MEKKRCYVCNESLPASSFGKNGYMKDGLDNICRACRRKKYLITHSNARRHFPEEITDEDLLRECRRRGLIESQNK